MSEEDLTDSYRAVAERRLRAWQERADAILGVVTAAEYEQFVEQRLVEIDAIDRGLLRRVLFSAGCPGRVAAS